MASISREELTASSSSFRQFISSLISELAQALSDSGPSINPLTNADQQVKHILLTLHTIFPDELLPALDLLDRRLVLRCKLGSKDREDEEANPSQDRSKYSRLEDSSSEGISSTNSVVDTDQAQRPTALLHSQSALQEDDTLLEEQIARPSAGALPYAINAKSKEVHTDPKTKDNVGPRAARSICAVNAKNMVIPADKANKHMGSRTSPPWRSLYYVRSGRQQPTRSKWRDAISETTAHYEVRLIAWSCSCPAFAFSAFTTNMTPRSLRGNEHSWQIGGISRGDDLPMCKHILACTLVDQCPQLAQFAEGMHVTTEEIAGWAAGYGD